jgi:multiple sugar transport system ATP-binding protein
MDEPLSNLDAKLRVSARAEITKLHKRLGTTFIYVTHDQVEAMTMGDRIMVINDGILQQIDSPRNLYNKPDNVFVAGFIGSPSMNFFDAKLFSEDGKLHVDTGDFQVHVPEDRKTAYQDYVGKDVVLGVRPENIHGAPYIPPNIDAAPIQANVEVVELLGHELHLFVNSGKNSFVSIVDTRLAPTVGNDVDLVINVDAMHLFDKNSERAIR